MNVGVNWNVIICKYKGGFHIVSCKFVFDAQYIQFCMSFFYTIIGEVTIVMHSIPW